MPGLLRCSPGAPPPIRKKKEKTNPAPALNNRVATTVYWYSLRSDWLVVGASVFLLLPSLGPGR